jgi:hypothetical protein
MSTEKRILPDVCIDKLPNQPFIGTAKHGNKYSDPDGIFTNPESGTIGGLDLSEKAYDPEFIFRGFEVHGVQNATVVMVEFADGSIGRYDNITIVEGSGWVEISGKWFNKILSEDDGTTATGIIPLF